MSRVIKLRAWDTISSRVLDVISIDFTEEECLLWDGELAIERKLEDLKLIQFTGLLDKNGKEIFEGDVIETETAFGKHRHLVRDCPDAWLDFASDMLGGITKNAYTVIGNIYEHPELLKGSP